MQLLRQRSSVQYLHSAGGLELGVCEANHECTKILHLSITSINNVQNVRMLRLKTKR